MVIGVDCVTNIDSSIAKRLKKAGYSFVCRYLYTDPAYFKTLKRSEVEAMTAEDLKILCVWETYASRINEGYAAGQLDAVRAIALAKSLGMPEGACIYYACDYPPERESEYIGIEEYLKGARSASDEYRVGVYGCYEVCRRMKEANLVDCTWQCVAWSGGRLYDKRNVYQEGAGRMVYDEQGEILEVDPDILYTSFEDAGLWNLNTKKKYEGRESKPGDWDYEAVEKAKKSGLMIGYPDGTFRPDSPVTRGELATVLLRLEKHFIDDV